MLIIVFYAAPVSAKRKISTDCEPGSKRAKLEEEKGAALGALKKKDGDIKHVIKRFTRKVRLKKSIFNQFYY